MGTAISADGNDREYSDLAGVNSLSESRNRASAKAKLWAITGAGFLRPLWVLLIRAQGRKRKERAAAAAGRNRSSSRSS